MLIPVLLAHITHSLLSLFADKCVLQQGFVVLCGNLHLTCCCWEAGDGSFKHLSASAFSEADQQPERMPQQQVMRANYTMYMVTLTQRRRPVQTTFMCASVLH